MNIKNIHCFIASLMWTCLVCSAPAQEVSISDPGLDSAIREALQKPVGPFDVHH